MRGAEEPASRQAGWEPNVIILTSIRVMITINKIIHQAASPLCRPPAYCRQSGQVFSASSSVLPGLCCGEREEGSLVPGLVPSP